MELLGRWRVGRRRKLLDFEGQGMRRGAGPIDCLKNGSYRKAGEDLGGGKNGQVECGRF